MRSKKKSKFEKPSKRITPLTPVELDKIVGGLMGCDCGCQDCPPTKCTCG